MLIRYLLLRNQNVTDRQQENSILPHISTFCRGIVFVCVCVGGGGIVFVCVCGRGGGGEGIKIYFNAKTNFKTSRCLKLKVNKDIRSFTESYSASLHTIGTVNIQITLRAECQELPTWLQTYRMYLQYLSYIFGQTCMNNVDSNQTSNEQYDQVLHCSSFSRHLSEYHQIVKCTYSNICK